MEAIGSLQSLDMKGYLNRHKQSQLQHDQEVLHEEQRRIQQEVRHEFFDQKNANELVEREMHNDSPEVAHVCGGVASSRPQAGQIVQAWRPTPQGEYQLGKGIIHRVHNHDSTVTVQFVPDQHRVRLPFMSVKPLFDFTPEYPTVRLAPGERLPTRSEILAREEEADLMRERMGIPDGAPLPEANHGLRAGETQRKDGTVVLRSDHWGIPAPTLDALRNRSIPPGQVTGQYGRHFYTNLYRNNFYLGQDQWVSPDGHVGTAGQHRRKDNAQHVLSHRYVPLEGPELEQDVFTGAWHPVSSEPEAPQPESLLSKLVWFLG